MGSTKTNTSTQSSGTSTQTVAPKPTKEETELNKLYLSREKYLDPYIRQTQQSGLTLSNELLQGQDLPGYLKDLPYGISPDVTQSIVNQSLRDLNTQLAYSGAGTFLESGASQSAGVRAAADVRNQSAQFNLQNLMQLLNVGIGGQAQVQQPILGFSNLLSDRLSGLRRTTTTGSYSGTQNTQQRTGYSFFTSPFTTAFAGGFGQGLGGSLLPRS